MSCTNKYRHKTGLCKCTQSLSSRHIFIGSIGFYYMLQISEISPEKSTRWMSQSKCKHRNCWSLRVNCNSPPIARGGKHWLAESSQGQNGWTYLRSETPVKAYLPHATPKRSFLTAWAVNTREHFYLRSKQAALSPPASTGEEPRVTAADWSSFQSEILLTWRGDSVLVGGFVVAQGEQQHLDGPGKDSSQAQVEYHIEQEDLDCGRKGQIFRKMGPIKAVMSFKQFGRTFRSLQMYSN